MKNMEIVNQMDGKGRWHGKRITYYDNGKISSIANFIHGKINGLVTTYSNEGHTFARVNFENGIIRGLDEGWSQNALYYQGNRINDLWEGEYLDYR
jgi:antitoxin component YwqK of YwqJK toxin-antitoxin module